MDTNEFNALSNCDKWSKWKKANGTWSCGNCGAKLDNPRHASPFRGSSICCSSCDAELTRRTSGGQMNPFNWVLKNDT